MIIKDVNGNNVEFTEREEKELCLAMLYEQYFNHGTTGHNQLMLIAKLAKALNLGANMYGQTTKPDLSGEIREGNIMFYLEYREDDISST